MASLPDGIPPSRHLTPAAPRYPADEILSLVDPDIRKPLDMGEVLLRIVDDSRLSLFKPSYGQNLITAWASILGECLVEVSRTQLIGMQDTGSALSQTNGRSSTQTRLPRERSSSDCAISSKR